MLFWLFIEKRMQKPADGAPVGWLEGKLTKRGKASFLKRG